jgi:hypothetical protein
MKYYETHFEEYITAMEKCDLHPELESMVNTLPSKMMQIENIIIYGPPGSGKYSQVLRILKKYSPSDLKYDKKITVQTEKQEYIYRISDVHFEIDMSLLGCNSKLLWNEIFLQIVDIISVKQEKIGIILCKNFHLIHAELLEIFYSYIQQYNNIHSNIKIRFFIVTEHLSFIPTTIMNACHILRVKRPSMERYVDYLIKKQITVASEDQQPLPISPINTLSTKFEELHSVQHLKQTSSAKGDVSGNYDEKAKLKNLSSVELINSIDIDSIANIKELRSFSFIKTVGNIPKDVFNIICDNIIEEMLHPEKIEFTSFRDTLYDILTYNLDMTDCLWYILTHFIEKQCLKVSDVSDILIRSYTFLKYYNNNYRPIYHLESILFYIINKLHRFNEL